MDEAAMHGGQDVIAWLHCTTEYSPIIAVEHAASAGQLATAQWLAEHAHEKFSDVWGHRLRGASIEIVIPYGATIGVFAWLASSFLSPGDPYANALVHRSCFIFRGTEVAMSAKKQIIETRLTKLPEPVAFAAEEGNIELLEALKRSRSLYN